MAILFLLYLILNPLCYWTGVELRPFQEYFFQCSSLILVGASLCFPSKEIVKSFKIKGIKIVDPMNIILGLMMIWFAIVFIRDNMGHSILINSFYGLLVYLTAIRTLEVKDIKFLFKGCLGVGVLSCIHLTGQYLGWDLRGQYLRDVVNGIPKCSFFGIRSFMGVYHALLIPMLLSVSWIFNFKWGKWWKNILLSVMVLLTITLFFAPVALSVSTGAFLGVSLGTLFFLWYKRRVLFWIILIPMLIGGGLFVVKMDAPLGMQGSRIDMWRLVIQDCHKKPFGYGLDSFYNNVKEGGVRYYKYSFGDKTLRGIRKGNEVLIQAKPSDDEIEQIKKWTKGGQRGFLDPWGEIHSIYLQTLYEVGIPGLLGIIMLLVFMARRFMRSLFTVEAIACASIIIILAVSGSTQFWDRVARVGHIAPVMLALFFIATEVKIDHSVRKLQ